MNGMGCNATRVVEEHVADGRYSVYATAMLCGNDVSVTIYGGTHHHIGAVALGIPRSSLKEDGTFSASVSVLCVTGHKEDEVARFAAKQLSAKFQCNSVVSAGIHIDQATTDEISVLWKNALAVISNIKDKIAAIKQSS